MVAQTLLWIEHEQPRTDRHSPIRPRKTIRSNEWRRKSQQKQPKPVPRTTTPLRPTQHSKPRTPAPRKRKREGNDDSQALDPTAYTVEEQPGATAIILRPRRSTMDWLRQRFDVGDQSAPKRRKTE